MPLDVMALKPINNKDAKPRRERRRRGPVDVKGIFVMLSNRRSRTDGYEDADNKYRMKLRADALIEEAVFDLLLIIQRDHPDVLLPTEDDTTTLRYLIGRKVTLVRGGDIDFLTMSLERKQRTYYSHLEIASYVCRTFNTHCIIPGAMAIVEHRDIVLIPSPTT